MSDSLSILLTIEAVDRATSIVGKIGDAMDKMSAKMLEAAQRSTRSASEMQAAQDRATASSTAYERALGAQAAAQAALREDTDALARAQSAQAIAAGQGAAATAAAADAVEAAAVKQVASLDALKVAEEETMLRAKENATAQAAMSTEMVSTSAVLKGAAIASAAVALGVGYIADKSVKAAADFQTGMLKMVTSAGETKGAIGDVSSKVLQMSIDTATSTDQLGKGLYYVESAGFHASNGITVLRAAAEGARAEGADLAEVANALTTALNDYGYSSNDAVMVTDMMVAAVSRGKMTMQQFSSSLSTVLPTAHSVGISFKEVAGAIATMTAQGISADQATTDLNHVINKLQVVTIDSTKYMAQLGLSATDISSQLGQRGLTGTMDIITKAILEHTHGNKVLVDSYNQSKTAAADLQQMLSAMPPDLRKISEAVQNGQMSFGEYSKEIKAMDAPLHAQGAQFLSLAGQADGFNQMLKSGQPSALEYTAALKKVVGDQTSLQSALALTNGGIGTFKGNVDAIGAAADGAGAHVAGWSDIQGTFNFKMDQLKESLHAVEIAIGTGLLPIVSAIATKIADISAPIVNWIMHHEKLTAIILVSIGVIAAIIAIVTTGIVVIGTLTTAMEALGITFGTILASTGIGLLLIALGAAAIYMATHWKQTKEVAAEVWHWIVSEAKTVADFFVGVWHDVVKEWDEIWGAVGGTVKKWWPLILAPVTGGLSLIVGFIIKYRKDISDAFSSVWEFLISVWNSTGGKLVTLIGHAWEVVSASVSKEWGRISSDLSKIWKELGGLWEVTGGKLVAEISKHWDTISRITHDVWNVIHAVLKNEWDLIWAVVSGVGGTILDYLKLTWDVVLAVTTSAWDLVWAYIKGVWDIIWGVIKAAADLIWAYLKTAFDTIIMVFEVAWDLIKGVVNTALDFIKGTIKIFIDFFTGNWGKLWKDVWDLVVTVSKDIWDTITSVFGDLWRWLTNVWNNIKDGIVGAWHAIWDGISGFLSQIWDGIKSAFTDGMNALSGIWNDLKKLAADPVNFVIDTVYNNGIRNLWNDVSGVFGGPTLGSINPIAFAQGGPVPGVGYGDTVPSLLTPGEFVLSHKMISMMGGLKNVLAIFGSGSGRDGMFAGGGLIGDVWGGISGAIGDIKNLALGGLRDAAKSGFDALSSVLGGIPDAGTGFGQQMLNGVGSMEKGILDFLGAKDKTAPKGVGDPLDTWMRQAIAATGAPMSWFKGLEIIAMNESGGDPNAINNWDINAQNGDPSRGLMQTIMSTFLAYHQGGTSTDIYDPVANIAAAINYIMGRYGDINAVPGIASMNRGGPYVGYEVGTWDTGSFSQMALLHPHEAILPAGVAGAMRGGGGGGNLIIDLRNSQIMSQSIVDGMIDKIERRIVVRYLPAGGVRMRM